MDNNKTNHEEKKNEINAKNNKNNKNDIKANSKEIKTNPKVNDNKINKKNKDPVANNGNVEEMKVKSDDNKINNNINEDKKEVDNKNKLEDEKDKATLENPGDKANSDHRDKNDNEGKEESKCPNVEITEAPQNKDGKSTPANVKIVPVECITVDEKQIPNSQNECQLPAPPPIINSEANVTNTRRGSCDGNPVKLKSEGKCCCFDLFQSQETPRKKKKFIPNQLILEKKYDSTFLKIIYGNIAPEKVAGIGKIL